MSVYFQHVIPFIYILMSCKKQICYTHIMQYIHEHICSLDGASFMTDYETAMRNAIAGQYPNMSLRCCWFHFCQAVKKKASTFGGFVNIIRNNLIEREIYYKLMCLPLLPPEMILTGFEILRKMAERVTFAPFHDFLKYYERQWIIRVCFFSIYFTFAFPLIHRFIDSFVLHWVFH